MLRTSLLFAVGFAVAACGQVPSQASGGRVTSRTAQQDAKLIAEAHDPERATALLRIARIFNEDYERNKDGAVYGRWDAASQSIISRATYLQRHRDCPNSSHVRVDTWGVTRGPGGAWLVHYSIDGQQFTDWWYYVRGRFVFDLPKSNPTAVALYRASPAQYAKDTGCGK